MRLTVFDIEGGERYWDNIGVRGDTGSFFWNIIGYKENLLKGAGWVFLYAVGPKITNVLHKPLSLLSYN